MLVKFLLKVKVCGHSSDLLLQAVDLLHHLIQLDTKFGELHLDKVFSLSVNMVFNLIQIREELLLTIYDSIFLRFVELQLFDLFI